MTWRRPPRRWPGTAPARRIAAHLAVRPLARALELAPDAAPVLSELVAALEHDGQHVRAVAVLEEHESVMGWLHRFPWNAARPRCSGSS
jgi:hypothetical protein